MPGYPSVEKCGIGAEQRLSKHAVLQVEPVAAKQNWNSLDRGGGFFPDPAERSGKNVQASKADGILRGVGTVFSCSLSGPRCGGTRDLRCASRFASCRDGAEQGGALPTARSPRQCLALNESRKMRPKRVRNRFGHPIRFREGREMLRRRQSWKTITIRIRLLRQSGYGSRASRMLKKNRIRSKEAAIIRPWPAAGRCCATASLMRLRALQKM